jgi:hypothetical protein
VFFITRLTPYVRTLLGIRRRGRNGGKERQMQEVKKDVEQNRIVKKMKKWRK